MKQDASLGRRAPEQRHVAVLDAAQALFIEQGVDKTSIASIAKQAGVGKGTVYLYFPSKADILESIEMRFNATITRRVKAASEDVAFSGMDMVVAWCTELVRAYLDNVALHDMLFYGRSVASREAIADNALIDDLTALLTSIDVCEPAATAAFLVGGVTLLVDRAVLEHREEDRVGLERSTQRLVGASVGSV